MTFNLIFDFILGCIIGLSVRRWLYWRSEAHGWRKIAIEVMSDNVFNSMVGNLPGIRVCAPPEVIWHPGVKGSPGVTGCDGENILPFRKPPNEPTSTL